MAKGLYIAGPGSVILRDVPEVPLEDSQVRIRAEFASIKHGTDFHHFSGLSPFERENFDAELRLFVPKSAEESAVPVAAGFAGNMVVGTVTEVGNAVNGFRPKDRVYCYGPACAVVTREARDVHALLPPLTEEDAVCLDPALYGCAAVRDARVSLGDNVVVFGLGAIGLLIVQMLKRAGCLHVIAVDPIEKRRTLAQTFGADLALDPTACDVARETRLLLGQGADAAIEASGSYPALQEATRAVGKCARVVTLGYYKGSGSLTLGKEWIHNRLELISSMPIWGNPPRDYPLWTEPRLIRTVESLFLKGRLTSQGLLDPVVAFADSASAFLETFHNPAQAIKLGIRFPA